MFSNFNLITAPCWSLISIIICLVLSYFLLMHVCMQKSSHCLDKRLFSREKYAYALIRKFWSCKRRGEAQCWNLNNNVSYQVCKVIRDLRRIYWMQILETYRMCHIRYYLILEMTYHFYVDVWLLTIFHKVKWINFILKLCIMKYLFHVRAKNFSIRLFDSTSYTTNSLIRF